MPKLEVAHSNINKTPSFTSIGSGGGGVGGGDHEVKPRDQEKADHPLKDEKPNNKRPPRTHRRPQRQKKQLDKQTEQQQQQQQQQQLQRPSRQLKVNADVKKTDAITSSAKDFDSLNTTTTTTATTTATSTPSRPARGGHPLGHKSPVKMAITTTSSGSPLSMGVHGGGVGNSSRGGGDGDDCRTGEMGVGGHLQSNYPTFAHPSMQQQQQQSFLQWPPPPYHPFYSKAASFQYRNQTHQSKVEFTDVRQMESTLYELLTDFHLGKLQAFGDGVTFENMIKVREQQENLARLHFELNLQQSNKHSFENDAFFSDSPSKVNSIISKPFSKSNMLKLIQNLQNLCKSIERLQWKNSNELEFN